MKAKEAIVEVQLDRESLEKSVRNAFRSKSETREKRMRYKAKIFQILLVAQFVPYSDEKLKVRKRCFLPGWKSNQIFVEKEWVT